VAKLETEWTLELTAERLESIRGPHGGTPLAAGAQLWERRGGAWSTVATRETGWRSVHAHASDDVWVSGSGGKTVHRGPAGWTEHGFDGGKTGLAVCGWPGPEAWSAVTRGEIQRFSGGAWTRWMPAALEDRHTGVLWGASPDDVWMHTHRRTTGVPPDLGHWDGSGWTFHTLSRNGYIANMHGATSDDVWAVGWIVKWIGKGPLAAHWNGARWLEVTLPTRRRLTDVYVQPNGLTWIAGFDGTLLRGRVGAFEAIATPGGVVNGVFANGDGRVWILVDGERIYAADL
jgi:hypothetical protein